MVSGVAWADCWGQIGRLSLVASGLREGEDAVVVVVVVEVAEAVEEAEVVEVVDEVVDEAETSVPLAVVTDRHL